MKGKGRDGGQKEERFACGTIKKSNNSPISFSKPPLLGSRCIMSPTYSRFAPRQSEKKKRKGKKGE
jgi:hypothetical protein